MATGVVYNSYKNKILQAGVNLVSDTLKIILLADTYTPDIDADEYYDDISANELSTEGGYTAGGATISGKSVTTDTGTNKAIFDCADPTWTADATGFTARYAVLLKDTGDPSTSPLIAYWDFGGNQNPVSIPFNLIVNAAGLLDAS